MTVNNFIEMLESKKGIEVLARKWAEDMAKNEDFCDYVDSEEYEDKIKENLPKPFQLYNKECVVMNVKHRGYPDSHAINNKMGIEVDDNVFEKIWDELRESFIHRLSCVFHSDNIAVVGRSGGYWGFKIAESGAYYSFLNFSKSKLTSLFLPILYRNSKRAINTIKKEYSSAIDTNIDFGNNSDFYQTLKYEFSDILDVKDCSKLTYDWFEKLPAFEKIMNREIKKLESTDYWVEILNEKKEMYR